MHRLYRSVCLTLCLFGATFSYSPAASAQTSTSSSGISEAATATDQNSAPVITTRLVSSHSQVTPGQTIQLAWEFKLSPHWHIYYSNAGDSGLPPQLKPSIAGAAALPLVWPTPRVISIPPVTNYGYEDAVTFTTNYTVPTGLAKGLNMMSFNASFLYCNDICMPGRAELKLPLTIDTRTATNPEFRPSTKLPTPLPANSNLVAETTGRTIQLNLPLNLATPQTRFIPAEDGVIDDSAPQTITGNTLSIQLDSQAEKTPTDLTGLLLINGQGYTFSVPLHQTSLRSNAESSQPPTAQTTSPMAPAASASFIGAVFFAFLAGVILNLMPCVLPVLSLKLLSLVRHHHGPSRVRHTVAYTLGILASFWVFAITIALLKNSGAQLGWGFHLQNPLFVAGLVLILFTVALNFFGLFELGHTLTRLGAKPGSHHPSLAASFGTGVLAVVVATPCTVPFMGGAMAYALTQSFFSSLLIFTTLGLGLALPFLVAIPFPAVFKWLPKPGKWMTTFRHALGWPMLATALWLLYVFSSQTSQITTFFFMGVMLVFAFSLWLYGTRSSAVTAALALLVAIAGLYAVFSYNNAPKTVIWQPFSVQAVEEARKTGPVFVDFTADWCLTCKVTEATVLSTTKTQYLFTKTGTTIFQADWTNQNPEITQELSRHNRKGVPLYLLYLPNKDAEILPQLLTYTLLKEKLEKAP